MFFLVTLLLIGAIALYLGDFLTRASSMTMTAYFEDARGLTKGADVRYLGIPVGKVLDVKVAPSPDFPDQPAAVRLAISRDAVIDARSVIAIQQGALLGDMYVDITPRERMKPRDKLTDGARVSGSDDAGLASIADEARSLVTQAKNTLSAINNTVSSEANRKAIALILSQVLSATRRADRASEEALALVAVMRKTFATSGPETVAMMRNLRSSSEAVRSAAQLVRVTLATSPVPGDLARTGANIREASEDVASMTRNLDAILSDPTKVAKVEALLADLQKSGQNLSSITGRVDQMVADRQIEDDLRTMITRLRDSADNVAIMTAQARELFTDDEFTGDIRGTVKAAREAAESGAEVMSKAGDTLDEVSQGVKRTGEIARSLRPEDVRSRATVEANAHNGLALDYEFDVQYGGRHDDFWRLGVQDIGDAERLSLQKSFPM